MIAGCPRDAGRADEDAHGVAELVHDRAVEVVADARAVAVKRVSQVVYSLSSGTVALPGSGSKNQPPPSPLSSRKMSADVGLPCAL